MTDNFEWLAASMRRNPRVVLKPPSGLPRPEGQETLPGDLLAFYELFGGAEFFPESPYPARVVGPHELLRTNELVWGADRTDLQDELKSDRSWHWYSIVSDEKGNYLSIDLAPQRLGRCYDSFSDRHAVPGESRVVANSFSDLLRRLLKNGGEYWYWLREDFDSLGDAYD